MKTIKKSKKSITPGILKKKLIQVDKIDLNSTMLDAQYICNNDNEQIFITVTMTGNVHAGEIVADLEHNPMHINGKTPLGTNNELNGKKLNLYRSISGDEGVPCIMTIYLQGGYKDAVYHLSSKVGSSGVLNFIAFIEFI